MPLRPNIQPAIRLRVMYMHTHAHMLHTARQKSGPTTEPKYNHPKWVGIDPGGRVGGSGCQYSLAFRTAASANRNGHVIAL